MDDDTLIKAVLEMSGKAPYAYEQDEWSIIAKALAFEVERQRRYIWNLRQELHLHEDCPGCPADAGEKHAAWCTDHPSNRPPEGTPGPTGDFLDDLARLVRDCEEGVR